MRYMARVAGVVFLALVLCQSAMAAPTHGAYMATTHSSNLGMFDHFVQIFGAIWGDRGAIWGDRGAIWGGPGSGSGDRGAIWGGESRATGLTTDSNGSKGSTTQGAIWGCNGQGRGC